MKKRKLILPALRLLYRFFQLLRLSPGKSVQYQTRYRKKVGRVARPARRGRFSLAKRYIKMPNPQKSKPAS